MFSTFCNLLKYRNTSFKRIDLVPDGTREIDFSKFNSQVLPQKSIKKLNA